MTDAAAAILTLPTATIVAGTPLPRIHREHRDAWHFSRSGSGRFDPVAASDPAIGACYLADDALGAFVEVYRRMGAISEADLATRRISTLSLSRDLVLVDLTDRAALLAGSDTSALSSSWDYREPQAFASAVADAGRDGVRYFARHDPAKRLCCNAILARTDDQSLSRASSSEISEPLRRAAATAFGYKILPVP